MSLLHTETHTRDIEKRSCKISTIFYLKSQNRYFSSQIECRVCLFSILQTVTCEQRNIVSGENSNHVHTN